MVTSRPNYGQKPFQVNLYLNIEPPRGAFNRFMFKLNIMIYFRHKEYDERATTCIRTSRTMNTSRPNDGQKPFQVNLYLNIEPPRGAFNRFMFKLNIMIYFMY